MLDQCFGKPGRKFTERVARRVSEPDELQRLIAPEGLDETGARLIRACRDMPDKWGRFERGAAIRKRPDHEQALAGLQVEADSHRELTVCLKSPVEIGAYHEC